MATTTADPATITGRPTADWTRNNARASGICYLLTFASSIAYYALLSFFPFVLLLLTIGGRLAIRAGVARGRPSATP